MSWEPGEEPDQHSRDNAARLLADPNYPSPFERGMMLLRQPERHEWKQVSNLLAMLDEARGALAGFRAGLAQIVHAHAGPDDFDDLEPDDGLHRRSVRAFARELLAAPQRRMSDGDTPVVTLAQAMAAGEALCARTPRCSGTHDCILPAGHGGFHSPRWDWYVSNLAALAAPTTEKEASK